MATRLANMATNSTGHRVMITSNPSRKRKACVTNVCPSRVRSRHTSGEVDDMVASLPRKKQKLSNNSINTHSKNGAVPTLTWAAHITRHKSIVIKGNSTQITSNVIGGKSCRRPKKKHKSRRHSVAVAAVATRAVVPTTTRHMRTYATVARQAAEAALTHTPYKPRRRRKRKGLDVPYVEKRLKQLIDHPPPSYKNCLKRASMQHFLVLTRKRFKNERDGCENEVFDLVGSTGNVYQITISKLPSCTCPYAKKKHHCKHIIFVSTSIDNTSC